MNNKTFQTYINVVAVMGPIIVAILVWSMPAKIREIVKTEVSMVDSKLTGYLDVVRYEREQASFRGLIDKLTEEDKSNREKTDRYHLELMETLHRLDVKVTENATATALAGRVAAPGKAGAP